MCKIGLTAVILLALNAATVKANAVIDSIGVENNNGKKLIIHQTVAKDTYYSIGRRYNVAPKDIMAYNNNKYLQVGIVIKVPTNIDFKDSGKNTQVPASKNTEHVVKAKENLNMLADKYGTTVNDIKSANNLNGNNLSIGQVLKIPVKGATADVPTEKVVAPSSKQQEVKEEVQSTAGTMIEHSVQPKEFLGKIAEKYGTTVEEIKKANNLTGNNLRIGQKLMIPATKNIEEDKVLSVTAPNAAASTEPVNSNGTHTVKTGETIFSIAKQYGITAYQIRKTNGFEDNALKPGQVIKLPAGTASTASEVSPTVVNNQKPAETFKEEPASKDESFVYNVSKGESIFSIAKKFNLTAYQIRQANKLKDNTLSTGQKLVIPKPAEPKSVTDLAKQGQQEEPDSASFRDPKLRGAPSKYGLSQIEEKGTAVSIADPDLDASKMLVLHRTAPIGTIIKLTNPMTNRTALAKVVGKFTENESTKDVIIVMTKAVADSLGALDKRFFCNLTYGVHELE